MFYEPRYNTIMDNGRTYEWYVRNDFWTSSGEWKPLPESSLKRGDTNLPGEGTWLKHITEMGINDQVVSVENITPLLEKVEIWWGETKKPKTPGDTSIWYAPGSSLRSLICRILKDNTLDPEIVRRVYEKTSFMTIPVVSSPSCPEDLLKKLIMSSGSKNDPTKDTKGGELTCFVLQNKGLSGELVDLCSRHTRKTSNLDSVVSHSNVLRETLVRMYHDPKVKSDTLKNSILQRMVSSGWLEVK